MTRSVEEAKRFGAAFLKDHGVENSARDSSAILASVLNIEESALHFATSPITLILDEEFLLRLKRRASGEPLQQIIGYVDFLGCRIHIDRAVLIPRQETELLADLIIQRLKPLPLQGKTLLDLCTGSGCLGIAIKKKLPQIQVLATDISSAALELAKRNSEENGVTIEFFQGDFFRPLEERRFDFVVSNPPYISEEEYQTLDPQVLLYEPRGALLAGKTGLEFYERFEREAPRYLNPSARIYFEIGFGQGKGVAALFSKSPWKNGAVEKDFASHDRFFSLEIE